MKISALLASLLAALVLSACGGDSGSTNSASATGGNAATGGSVCDEYEKAFAASIANVDAATKEAMQKAFDQMQNLPADQKEAACKVSLDALNGKAPAGVPTSTEDAKEAASEAAEEAKEAAADQKEAASEAAEEAASK